MADAYKGLTIRIGADTQGFKRALSTVNSAITSTQGNLRKLQSALNLDPTNASAASKQFGALSSAATAYSAKLATIKREMDELGASKISKGTVAEVSAGIEDAALKASRLNEQYNQINEHLARMYNGVEAATVATGKLQNGIKLDNDNIFSAKNIERARELGVEIDTTSDNAVTLARKLQAAGVAISDDDIARIAELRKNLNETNTSMQEMKTVSAYQQLGVDAEVASAKANNLASKLVEVASATLKVKTTNAFTTQANQIKTLDNALDLAQQKFRALDEAVRLDSSNVVLAEQRTVALGNATELTKAKIEAINTQLNNVKQAAKENGLDASFKNVSKSVSEAEAKLIECRQRVIELSGQLDDAQAEQNQLKNTVQETSPAYTAVTAKVEKLTAELNQAEDAAGQANSEFQKASTANTYEELTADLARATTQLKELENSSHISSSIWNNLQTIGNGLRSTITPALMQVGQYSITAANEIDSAYRDMRKTVEGTDQQFEQLRAAAIEFSTTHVTSADQMLEIEAMGGQLGIGVEQLGAFAETVSNLGVATNMTTDDIAQNLGQLANIMDDLHTSTGELDTASVEAFGDALVRLGNNEPALESSIMEISTRIAGMSNILGISSADMLGWATALASTGQNSEAAGTALSKTMSDIESAVGAGGDALQAFADVAGMSAEEFKAAWDNDASGAMQTFIEGLKRIDESGGSVDNTLESLGITAVRQKQGLMALSQTTDVLSESLQMANDAWSSGGDAAVEAAKKAEGFSGQLSILQNNAQAAGAEIAEGFTPYLKLLNTVVTGVTSALADMDTSTKAVVIGIGGIAAAIGPVVIAISALHTAMENIKGFKSVQKLSNAFNSLKDVMGITSGLASGLLAIGLTALAATLTYVVSSVAANNKKWGDFNDSLEEVRGSAQKASSELGKTDDSVDSLGSNLKNVSQAGRAAAMTLEELTTWNEQLATQMQQTTQSASDQCLNLDTAQEIIERYANQTGLNATQQQLLKEAIDEVNAAGGEQYSVVDAANGKIADENGTIQENTDKIKANIEALKEQAVVNALLENYGTANSAHLTAQSNYEQALAEYRKIAKDGTQQEIADARESLKGAREELEATGETLDRQSQLLAEATGETDGFASAIDNLHSNFELANNVLGEGSDDLEEFKQQLADAGISWDQFGTMSRDSATKLMEAFARGELSGSDLLKVIDELNITPLGDKSCEVTAQFDSLTGANDEIYTYNGTQLLDKDGSVVAEDQTLEDALGNIYRWNAQEGRLELIYGEADVDADGVVTATDILQAYKDLGYIPDFYATATVDSEGVKEATTNNKEYNLNPPQNQSAYITLDSSQVQTANVLTATHNTNPPQSQYAKVALDSSQVYTGLNRRQSWNSGKFKDDSATVSIFYEITSRIKSIVSKVTEGGNAKGGIRTHADGGIRKHADGFIANRPGAGVPLDIVGEAGAEAIVPLTNRRYSQPFVDLIAEGIEKRLGSGGDTYYILNVDGARVNDDAAIRENFITTMYDMQRLAGMNRG